VKRKKKKWNYYVFDQDNVYLFDRDGNQVGLEYLSELLELKGWEHE